MLRLGAEGISLFRQYTFTNVRTVSVDLEMGLYGNQ